MATAVPDKEGVSQVVLIPPLPSQLMYKRALGRSLTQPCADHPRAPGLVAAGPFARRPSFTRDNSNVFHHISSPEVLDYPTMLASFAPPHCVYGIQALISIRRRFTHFGSGVPDSRSLPSTPSSTLETISHPISPNPQHRGQCGHSVVPSSSAACPLTTAFRYSPSRRA